MPAFSVNLFRPLKKFVPAKFHIAISNASMDMYRVLSPFHTPPLDFPHLFLLNNLTRNAIDKENKIIKLGKTGEHNLKG